MKKLLAMALITSMLALPGLALAEENGAGAAGSPDGSPVDIAATSLPAEEDAPVVGEDITIGEDEFKIVSVEEDNPEEAPVVGEDIEIREGEVKIVSVEEDAPVAEEVLEMSEEEARILSAQSGIADESAADTQEQGSNNTLLFSGIGAGAIVLAAAGGVLSKKRKKMSR